MLVACAVVYYRAARMEDASGLLWSGLSVLVFVITWIVFSWSWQGCLVGQAGLFAGITVVQTVRRK
jgi:hypothetical protein